MGGRGGGGGAHKFCKLRNALHIQNGGPVHCACIVKRLLLLLYCAVVTQSEEQSVIGTRSFKVGAWSIMCV